MTPIVEIETCTREVLAGRQASGFYLQLLVRAVQGAVGDETSKPLQMDAVSAVHEQFYPIVLRTIGDEVSAVERNRRGTFARSAASTLRLFVKRGGNIIALDSNTVSKQGLREYGLIGARRRGATRSERAFTKAYTAVERIALSMGKEDPRKARMRLQAAIESLQATLKSLTPAPRVTHAARAPSRTPRRVTGRRNRAPQSLVVHRAMRGPSTMRGHA